jgi:hypothetical protein
MELLMVDEYRAGACNIGPTEIAARRRFGHVSTAVTIGLLVVLVISGVPAWWRVSLFVPAAGAAAGYLQAALRFCADYGWRGVFNLDDRLRHTTSVADAQARAADRRKAVQIMGASALVGAATVLVSLAF